jgi:hypothetical protein
MLHLSYSHRIASSRSKNPAVYSRHPHSTSWAPDAATAGCTAPRRTAQSRGPCTIREHDEGRPEALVDGERSAAPHRAGEAYAVAEALVLPVHAVLLSLNQW